MSGSVCGTGEKVVNKIEQFLPFGYNEKGDISSYNH